MRFIVLEAALAALPLLAATALADTVVPAANAAVEGNINNVAPLALGYNIRTAMRYQQVYAAERAADGKSPEAAARAFSAAVEQIFGRFAADLHAIAASL